MATIVSIRIMSTERRNSEYTGPKPSRQQRRIERVQTIRCSTAENHLSMWISILLPERHALWEGSSNMSSSLSSQHRKVRPRASVGSRENSGRCGRAKWTFAWPADRPDMADNTRALALRLTNMQTIDKSRGFRDLSLNFIFAV